jgi:hypothetical protein
MDARCGTFVGSLNRAERPIRHTTVADSALSPGSDESGRPDSNRGPLHYENRGEHYENRGEHGQAGSAMNPCASSWSRIVGRVQ